MSDKQTDSLNSAVPCPHCHGSICFINGSYKCVGKEGLSVGCGLIFRKSILNRLLSQSEVESILKFRRVGPLDGFFTRAGKSFSAALKLVPDPENSTLKLEFDMTSQHKSSGSTIECVLDKPNIISIIKQMDSEIIELVEDFKGGRRRIETLLDQEQVPNTFRLKLTRSLNFSDITYSAYGVEKEWSQFSRVATLVCGPMFLSESFPQPKSDCGNLMFPLLQINFSDINRWTHHSFSEGLLQLWLSAENGECFLRVIPSESLESPVIEIDYPSESHFIDTDVFIPYSWYDRSSSKGIEIVRLNPMGVSTPDIAPLIDEALCDEYLQANPELMKLLNKIVDNKFMKSMDVQDGWVFNLFGYFRSSVDSSWDDNMSEKALLHTSDWLCGSHVLNIFYSDDLKFHHKFRLSIVK